MDILTVDFETYYDNEYSLFKMSTWDYITDPRFEVIGVSVKINDAPAVPFTGSFVETHAFLSQFNWNESAGLGHNAAFDLAVLRWKFGISTKRRLDTWSMCNALHGSAESCSLANMARKYNVGEKGHERETAKGKRRADFSHEEMNAYMTYCCGDSDLTYELFRAVLAAGFPLPELRVIDWTMRCYVEPRLQVNHDLLATELSDVRKRKAAALKASEVTDLADLRKDEFLADLLRSLGVEPPMKTTPKGNVKYAFAKADVAFLELREHENDIVSAIVDARLEAKSSIEETRLASLIQIAEKVPLGLPFPLTYFGASTGRWSAWDDINMQNLPKKGRIREGVTAPPGKKILAADLSQIELRILAWASGQQNTLDELRDGKDTYSLMAGRIYGRLINKKTDPTERFVGKSATLGCGFGCGWKKFKGMVLADAKKYGIVLDDTSDTFFERVVNTYREANPMVRRFWKEAEVAINHMLVGGSGYIGKYRYVGNKVYLPRGIPLTFTNLRREFDPRTGRNEVMYDRYNPNKGRTATVKLWYGLLVENIVQATARDVFVNCLHNCESGGYYAVGSVHDELLFLVSENEVETAMKELYRLMCIPPDWLDNCPLDSELNFGDNYHEAK